MSLEDLLGVLQHGLVAKLQVELETQKREFALFVCFQYKAFKLSIKLAINICEVLELSVSHLLLQHVLPLLPHLLHQQRQVRDPVSGLQLLQCSVQQAEGASAPHARAKTRRTHGQVTNK